MIVLTLYCQACGEKTVAESRSQAAINAIVLRVRRRATPCRCGCRDFATTPPAMPEIPWRFRLTPNDRRFLRSMRIGEQ